MRPAPRKRLPSSSMNPSTAALPTGLRAIAPAPETRRVLPRQLASTLTDEALDRVFPALFVVERKLLFLPKEVPCGVQRGAAEVLGGVGEAQADGQRRRIDPWPVGGVDVQRELPLALQ